MHVFDFWANSQIVFGIRVPRSEFYELSSYLKISRYEVLYVTDFQFKICKMHVFDIGTVSQIVFWISVRSSKFDVLSKYSRIARYKVLYVTDLQF